AERARAEVEPLAPVAGMIPLAADERAHGADAEPMIPVEAGRYGIDAIRHRAGVAPLLAAPGVNLSDPADGVVLDEPHGQPVFHRGMNLDAHLRNELFLAREF